MALRKRLDFTFMPKPGTEPTAGQRRVLGLTVLSRFLDRDDLQMPYREMELVRSKAGSIRKAHEAAIAGFIGARLGNESADERTENLLEYVASAVSSLEAALQRDGSRNLALMLEKTLDGVSGLYSAHGADAPFPVILGKFLEIEPALTVCCRRCGIVSAEDDVGAILSGKNKPAPEGQKSEWSKGYAYSIMDPDEDKGRGAFQVYYGDGEPSFKNESGPIDNMAEAGRIGKGLAPSIGMEKDTGAWYAIMSLEDAFGTFVSDEDKRKRIEGVRGEVSRSKLPEKTKKSLSDYLDVALSGGGKFAMVHAHAVANAVLTGMKVDLQFESELMKAWCGGGVSAFLEKQLNALSARNIPKEENEKLNKMIGLALTRKSDTMRAVAASNLYLYYTGAPEKERMEKLDSLITTFEGALPK